MCLMVVVHAGLARSLGLAVDSYEVRLPSRLATLHSTAEAAAQLGLGRWWRGVSVRGSNRDPLEPAPLCAVLAPAPQPPTPPASASSASSPCCCQLLVLPYNFPLLLPLLQQARDLAASQGSSSSRQQLAQCSASGEVQHLPVLNPASTLSKKWVAQMTTYLQSVPSYYLPALYKCFQPLGIEVMISLLTGGATAAVPLPDTCISHAAKKALLNLQAKVRAELRVLESQLLVQSNVELLDVGFGDEVDDNDNDGDTSSELGSISAFSTGTWSSERASADASLRPYSPSRMSSELDRLLVPPDPAIPLAEAVSTKSSSGSKDSKSKEKEGELQSYLRRLGLPLLDRGGAGGDSSVPALLVPPPAHDLLLAWEGLRGRLFGGRGGGLVVSGLFLAGRVSATGGSVVRGASLLPHLHAV